MPGRMSLAERIPVVAGGSAAPSSTAGPAGDGASPRPARLLVFTTHPIQYQAPWFRALAAEPGLDLRVAFSRIPDAREQAVGFGGAFQWDIPLLDGYGHEALPSAQLPSWTPEYLRRPARGIGSLLRRWQPDVAMVLGWQELSLLQAIKACRSAGVPVILRGESNAKRPRSALARAFHRTLLANVDLVLAIGRSNADFYRSYGFPKERILEAPYFVDNDRFVVACEGARPQRTRWRRDLGIPEDTFCAAFVGKLEQKKRPFDFIDAIIEASHATPGIHGLIVGDGPLRRECEARVVAAEANVTFAGFVNQTALPRVYAGIDALVLPSDFGETWGLVANEAMACGAPVIVSERAGCADDLVLDGETGAVVPFADPHAIAAHLVHWARHPEHRGQLAEASRRHVTVHYTIERAVTATISAVALMRGQGQAFSADAPNRGGKTA